MYNKIFAALNYHQKFMQISYNNANTEKKFIFYIFNTPQYNLTSKKVKDDN